MRYTVSVDFDGVLHSWDGDFRGAHVITGDPIPGAIEWLAETIDKFDVAINSTRCNTWRGRRAIRSWLRKHAGSAWHDGFSHTGIEGVIISRKKMPSLVYIDDRALRFEGPGTWPTSRQVHDARPWFKKTNGESK